MTPHSPSTRSSSSSPLALSGRACTTSSPTTTSTRATQSPASSKSGTEGWGSTAPWAVRIAPENRPAEFADAAAFHPTFLYESIWDLLVCLILLWVARRFAERLRDGDMVLLYISLYSVGRFFVETLRVDPAFLIGGSIRGNLFVSSLLALGCAMILLLRHSRPPRKLPGSD